MILSQSNFAKFQQVLETWIDRKLIAKYQMEAFANKRYEYRRFPELSVNTPVIISSAHLYSISFTLLNSVREPNADDNGSGRA